MAEKDLILDFSQFDLSHVIADQEAIRKVLPQRHEFEQLTAVVYDDPTRGICVGYKDIHPDEFWIRGHMPGLPLMPGVMMCEAAAQLCTYHVQSHGGLGVEMIGFGGLDRVKFRGMVYPGDRLVLMAQQLALRAGAMVRSRFQCFVNQEIVCEGEIRGVPIPVDILREQTAARDART